jgi:AcrR family transcriptional regulator
VPKLVDRDARRTEIGEAVLRALVRDGEAQLTLRSVAREAGCSVGVLQHYFADRDELVSFANQLAFERAQRRGRAILERESPSLRTLGLVLMQGLPLDRQRVEEWAAWLLFWSHAMTSSRLRKEQARRYDTWRGVAQDLLSEAEQNGELVPGLDLELEAEMLVAFVDGIGLQGLFEPRRLTADVLVSMLEVALQRLGGGAVELPRR